MGARDERPRRYRNDGQQAYGLKALHVDAAYIRGMAAAGYPELRAGKLTEMKAVGVTPEKAHEAKALGFQPTEQELVQMSFFKIDRPFVERHRHDRARVAGCDGTVSDCGHSKLCAS